MDRMEGEISRAKSEISDKTRKISDSIDSKPKFEFDGNVYRIPTKRGVYELTKEEADALFADFSRHGANLSGEEMRIKYELKPEAWIAIKSALGLYKDSHVVSPKTVETSSEEEVAEIVERAIGSHIDKVKGKMVQTHARMFDREAKRALKIIGNVEYFLENLREFVAEYEPRKTEFPMPEPVENGWKHYFISDIHIGKLDTEGVLRRLAEVKREIVESDEGTAYITFGGDLGETFAQDGNHPGMLAYGTEERWGRGFDLMLNISRIFEDFLIDVRKSGKRVIVNGITGNHGRVTGQKDDDIMRTAELTIYELIKRGISQTDIEMSYAKDSVTILDIEARRFVMIHGDAPLGNQNPEKLILPFFRPGAEHVVVTGDRHSLSFREGFGYTYVRSPALAGKGHYDSRMNLHSRHGYLVFSPNGDILIKRLR